MDTQFSFSPRDELWRLQNDMKSVFAVQAEHSDRLLRLERRNDEDMRMKSVWGSSSPFPGVLSGTPQQDPGYNPASEAFKSFDQDQNINPLGTLHLDTEEEPRRGASRANSVRFDESALHGHFGYTSRSSSELFPLRIGSGMGGHPMTERSSSHKSDGRQSSMGVSAHSTHLNSLALESRPTLEDNLSIGPPPGLSFLGPLPAIIRCWLDTTFSNESLLYAAVCTGSYRSILSYHMATRLGLAERIVERNGESRLKLHVYLPEATIQHSFTRPASPASQLPAITVEFEVHDTSASSNGIQIFLGGDLLRARSADILFSQDRMTILDDDRNKLAVPLVRPENLTIFRNLVTLSIPDTRSYSLLTKQDSITAGKSNGLSERLTDQSSLHIGSSVEEIGDVVKKGRNDSNNVAPIAPPTKQQSTVGDVYGSPLGDQQAQANLSTGSRDTAERFMSRENGSRPETPSHSGHATAWSSWRRDSAQNMRQDSTFSSVASSSGHNKTSRGKGMKVLKPIRSSGSRSASTVHTPTSVDITPRWQDEVLPTPSGTSANVNVDVKPSRALSPSDSKSDVKSALPSTGIGNKARTTNPVGGASAFGWLNSSQRQSSASID